MTTDGQSTSANHQQIASSHPNLKRYQQLMQKHLHKLNTDIDDQTRQMQTTVADQNTNKSRQLTSIDQLRNEMKRLQAKKNQMSETIETSGDDRSRVDNDVHEAHLQLNTIRNKMKSADKREKASQLKLSHINDSIGHSIRLHHINQNRHKQLGGNLKIMQNIAKHTEKDVDSIEKEKRFQNAHIERIEHGVSIAENELTALNEKINEINEQNIDYRSTIDDLREKVRTYRTDQRQFDQQWQQLIRQIEHKDNAIKQTIDSVQREEVNARQSNMEQFRPIKKQRRHVIVGKARLEQSVSDRETTISKEMAMMKKLRQYIDEANRSIDERQMSIRRLQDEIDQLAVEENGMMGGEMPAKSTIDSRTAQRIRSAKMRIYRQLVKEKQTNIKDYKRRIKQLKIETKKKRNNPLQSKSISPEMNQLEAEETALKYDEERLNNELAEKTESIKVGHRALNQLYSKNKILENALDSDGHQQRQIDAKQSKGGELRTTIEQLQDDIGQMNEQMTTIRSNINVWKEKMNSNNDPTLDDQSKMLHVELRRVQRKYANISRQISQKQKALEMTVQRRDGAVDKAKSTVHNGPIHSQLMQHIDQLKDQVDQLKTELKKSDDAERKLRNELDQQQQEL